MSKPTIITNNLPRHTMDRYELTEKESAEFDYLPDGEGTFFRYRGHVYDLGEFMRTDNHDSPFAAWHGYSSDSYFSGILIKLPEDDCDSVIVGRYCS